MSISYKCPQCAANLFFDADQQKMTCNFCGAEIMPEVIETAGMHLNSRSMEEKKTRNKQIHEKSAEAMRASRAITKKIKKQEYAAFTESESIQYICGSCGAAVVTDKNTTATFCAFCGSPAIITERLVDARKPDYIIPFKYGRENAVQSFFKWCKSGRMTPIDFVKKENIEKLTGLYVPFWLFNSEVDMDCEVTGVNKVTEMDYGSLETTTATYKVTRKGKICWKMIPYDGASHMDDQQMKMIAPYDYRDIKDFDMVYLAGFFADRYDVPPEKVEYALKKDISSYINQIFEASLDEYSSYYSKRDHSKIHPPEVKYALLPVWVLNYKYQGKMYTFAMNGQTGKTAGEYPISLVKLFVILLALLPVAAVLVRLLIGGLVLGGIF